MNNYKYLRGVYYAHHKMIESAVSKNLCREGVPTDTICEVMTIKGVMDFFDSFNTVVMDHFRNDARCAGHNIDPNHECSNWSCVACYMDILHKMFSIEYD